MFPYMLIIILGLAGGLYLKIEIPAESEKACLAAREKATLEATHQGLIVGVSISCEKVKNA